MNDAKVGKRRGKYVHAVFFGGKGVVDGDFAHVAFARHFGERPVRAVEV